MAGIRRLVDTHVLKTNLWKEKFEQENYFYTNYNERADAFTFLLVDPHTRRRTHYLDDYVALEYDPETYEIVGLRVESFRRGFLPKYANLEQAWKLSDICELDDFGDLLFEVKRMKHSFANELSRIAYPIAEQNGIALPVPA